MILKYKKVKYLAILGKFIQLNSSFPENKHSFDTCPNSNLQRSHQQSPERKSQTIENRLHYQTSTVRNNKSNFRNGPSGAFTCKKPWWMVCVGLLSRAIYRTGSGWMWEICRWPNKKFPISSSIKLPGILIYSHLSIWLYHSGCHFGRNFLEWCMSVWSSGV